MNDHDNYSSRNNYKLILEKFDAAVCEAIAISQASSGRLPVMNVGYASHVFTQMCGAAVSLIRAAPMSRWVRSDSEDWRFGAIAGHARSILDGCLLFNYLIQPYQSELELRARINVMHLNDCTRRMDLHKNLEFTDDIEGFEMQRSELQERLTKNDYFNSLPRDVQKRCISGKYLFIDSRDELLSKAGFKKGEFNALYDLWSQHIHILPLSFYRTEPNGRGTGVENDCDRGYMVQALEICKDVIVQASDLMEKNFPDISPVRKGINSKFSPGPDENKPNLEKVHHFKYIPQDKINVSPKKKTKKNETFSFKKSSISEAIQKKP